MAAEYNLIIDSGNISRVRYLIMDELLADPTCKEYTKIVNYAKEKLPDLFEKDDEVEFDVPNDEWDSNTLRQLEKGLRKNFSERRLNKYVEVVKVVLKDKSNHIQKEEVVPNRKSNLRLIISIIAIMIILVVFLLLK